MRTKSVSPQLRSMVNLSDRVVYQSNSITIFVLSNVKDSLSIYCVVYPTGHINPSPSKQVLSFYSAHDIQAANRFSQLQTKY